MVSFREPAPYPENMGIAAGRHNLTGKKFHLALREDRVDGESVIDLRKARYIGPYGFVGIACVAAAAQREGREVRVQLPKHSPTRARVARMQLGEVLSEELAITIPGLRRVRKGKAHGRTLVELHWISGDTGYEQIANLLWNRLTGRADPQVVNTLYDAFVELSENVSSTRVPRVASPPGRSG